jgi:hypothetical protein
LHFSVDHLVLGWSYLFLNNQQKKVKKSIIKQVFQYIEFLDSVQSIAAIEQEYVQVNIEEFDQLMIKIAHDKYFQRKQFSVDW